MLAKYAATQSGHFGPKAGGLVLPSERHEAERARHRACTLKRFAGTHRETQPVVGEGRASSSPALRTRSR